VYILSAPSTCGYITGSVFSNIKTQQIKQFRSYEQPFVKELSITLTHCNLQLQNSHTEMLRVGLLEPQVVQVK